MLFLIPTEPADKVEKIKLWENGQVICFGKGKFWFSSKEAYQFTFVSLATNKDSSDDQNSKSFPIKDVIFSSNINSIFIILDHTSGVFACSWEEDSSHCCIALTGGQLISGLKTANAFEGNGIANSIELYNGYLALGDSLGNVSIWDIQYGNISDPPIYIFGAHGKLGCSNVKFISTSQIITTGGALNEIKVWNLLDDNIVQCYATLTLPFHQKILSQPCFLRLDDENQFLLFGISLGRVGIWNFSENHRKSNIRCSVSLKIHEEIEFLQLVESSQTICSCFITKENFLLVSTEDGSCVLFDVKNRKTILLQDIGYPVIGIYNQSIVLDENHSIEMDELDCVFHQDNQQEMNNIVDSCSKSKVVKSYATRHALNRSRRDATTFGTDLMKISHSSCPCCHPIKENPIWVKRKVKPPTIKKPRESLNAKKENQTNLNSLPPFCEPRFRSSWISVPYLLVEKDGSIYVNQETS